MNNNIPLFIIKRNLQKSEKTGLYFSDVVTEDILQDICYRITGLNEFNHQYVANDYEDDILSATYNQGRLVILKYNNSIKYISISEECIEGRNSSIQSVPTSFNLYYLNKFDNKELYYYFLPIKSGNPKTDYHLFIYRLMAVIGFKFLNPESIDLDVQPFLSINDLLLTRKDNSNRKTNNNSTYITKNSRSEIEIYGKTYGANKYETSLICYAISFLIKEQQKVILYQILDNNLKELPKNSLLVIKKMQKITKIISVSSSFNRGVGKLNLRSPRYIFNLLDRLGDKLCALCHCAIPEIVEAAHIWDIASIKNNELISDEEKFRHAISEHNGIWLCSNHHKLFDKDIIKLTNEGNIEFNISSNKDVNYLQEITKVTQIPNHYMSNEFKEYLMKRNVNSKLK